MAITTAKFFTPKLYFGTGRHRYSYSVISYFYFELYFLRLKRF
jgi:hypothetical protein